MRRGLALLWLAVLLSATLYLGARVQAGLVWDTNLLALLPRDAIDAERQQADDAVTQALSQRVLLLVGSRDAAVAHQAAAALTTRFAASGLGRVEATVAGPEVLRALGTLYAPFRRGLLSEADRAALARGDGEAVAARSLSQVFGFVGVSDARLLRMDPFLLLAGYFAALPVPFAGLVPDDGILMVPDGNRHWALVLARLTADPYALDVQEQLEIALDTPGLTAAWPGTRVLRLGAVFFAHAGAQTALTESTQIGLASSLGTVLLVLLAYRALTPLWLSVLVIGAGVLVGTVTSLLLFGRPHVATLLFGVTLIGVAVDYSLQYCTEVFAAPGDSWTRLKRVRAGIALGSATTVIGYLTLLLAPFPGLYQIAAFSAAGLVAAWLTVMLWLPLLDRGQPARHGRRMLAAAASLLALWQRPRRRTIAITVTLVIVVAGLSRLHADDDVRRMQSLSAPLLADQAEIRRLIGGTGEGPFLLIRAQDDEAALRTEEILAEQLAAPRREGALSGWLTPAAYVPSAARQRMNRALVARVLDPLLANHLVQLGLEAEAVTVDDSAPILTLPAALAAGAPFGALVMEPGLHVMLLEGLTRPAAVAAAVAGVPGVAFVDPAGRFSALLGKYRVRAIGLLVLSAVLMAPILVWRYGWRAAGRVMLPPSLAVLSAPALRALCGGSFGFFDAMALVLILAIGVDYAIFCAETRTERAPVTMLAVALAAATALLSFGLLTLSEAAAVHNFGATMTLGILVAFLLAPLARKPEP